MADQHDTIVTLEVPPTDSPDDVTAFVAQVQSQIPAERGVHLELEVLGGRRYLHVRRTSSTTRSGS